MSRIRLLPVLLATLVVLAVPAMAQAAPAAPGWHLQMTPYPTNFLPGATAEDNLTQYTMIAKNVGNAPTSGPVTITATIPAELEIADFQATGTGGAANAVPCSQAGQEITCTTSGAKPVAPDGGYLELHVAVNVEAGLEEGSVLTPEVTLSGGGAPPATIAAPTTVSSTDAPFDLLPGAGGFAALLSDEGAGPVTQAGSHPNQLSVDLGFSSLSIPGAGPGFSSVLVGSGGGVRDNTVALPKGFVLDPSATPVRCTEAELEAGNCPTAAAVGMVSIVFSISGNTSDFSQQPLYNMVPAPGVPASLGFDAVGAGIFVHINGGVRAGDYVLTGSAKDILARFGDPILNVKVELWGKPADPSHDSLRGNCAFNAGGNCPVDPSEARLLTMPTSCEGNLEADVEADSWKAPGAFIHRTAPITGPEGTPVAVTGCNQLEFEPTLQARPTTNTADSPSGLEVDLQIPQAADPAAPATAHLRKAAVTLPEGLVVNPSSANGLDACSSAQIGIDPTTGRADGAEPSCPAASKIGNVEVDSPLLAQYGEDGKVARDPETGQVIPEPLPGSVYLAKPFDNPFGSLLGIYVVVEDPQHGILVKLAGHVEPDPQTGRLRTTFDENPQLPFTHFKLSFFKGASAALRTPAACGTYSTTSELTPWSAPESGPPATPADTYAIDHAPGGGACPTSAAALPSAPAFDAGTIAPQAGAYSPFVLKLSREDGSATLDGFDTLLPPGLSGKLAGIAECPEAQIARAISRSAPDQGILERNDPSCPQASALGTVNVAAGAGPTPYYARGTAYLAGPYKSAPLSMVVITPAIAGPFDLGTVVVRAALNVDPFTAQIHAVSDPFPTILHGIPLDLRSVAVKLDRPGFTLNPTSCEEMAITGSATSPLGQIAPLRQRFQVGGCSALKFKPTLTLKLKGGTDRTDFPSLRAKLTFPKTGAYANIASAQVNLPHSEFLEQGHIGTVCTRPQLASHTCPAKSVYGYAKAVTPLLDKPLEGPVYLGVGFGHKLPDLVADLNGQIEVLLHGKTDSGKNKGLRNTFQVVPDAPVSSFTLTLFGGKRGLIVNSENLCSPKAETQAFAHFVAQNGQVANLKPKVQNGCGGRRGR
jgi:hypothetical protein